MPDDIRHENNVKYERLEGVLLIHKKKTKAHHT